VSDEPFRFHASKKPLPPVLDPPGPLKYNFIRFGLRFFIGFYLRIRLERAELLPQDQPFLVCFSHPNWVDPMILVAHWPQKRWLYIFGPREEDMKSGWRNRLITWARIAVPFRPEKDDLLDTTRRAVGVMKKGYILAIAGEGRLSDRDGAIVPLQDGAAFFALRARVPIAPVAIIGTRWLRFRKVIKMRFGEPVATDGRRADRETMAAITAELEERFKGLLADVVPEPPPGRFGRWITDVFNERPWLTDPSKDPTKN
jgi:1-acyl-sn-glycerol-3-phosphate acyltransferase